MQLKTCFFRAARLLLPLIFLPLVAGLSGCSSAQKVNDIQARRSSGDYQRMRYKLEQSPRIARGNTLHVEHGGDPTISGTYKVDFEGRIQMPYKVTLMAAGLLTTQLEQKIKDAYAAYVKGDYPVHVEITDRKVWIEVRGEVKKPGRYLVRIDMPLEEIVSMAGGFVYDQAGGPGNPDNRPDYLHIKRPASETAEKSSEEEENGPEMSSTWFSLSEYFSQYDTEPDFLWRGGEILFFQRTAPEDAHIKKNWQTITVMGEVHDPKELPVLPNADLLTYISRAGGPTASADLSEVEIIHRGTDEHVTANLIKDRMFNELKAGDVIVVRAIVTAPTILDKVMQYTMTAATVALSVIAIIVLP